VARNDLTTGQSPTNAANFSTTSITPGANRLVLAFVFNGGQGFGTAATPTANGNGLTWGSVGTVTVGALNDRRLTCFRAMEPHRPLAR
jgi:hypothetical protein